MPGPVSLCSAHPVSHPQWPAHLRIAVPDGRSLPQGSLPPMIGSAGPRTLNQLHRLASPLLCLSLHRRTERRTQQQSTSIQSHHLSAVPLRRLRKPRDISTLPDQQPTNLLSSASHITSSHQLTEPDSVCSMVPTSTLMRASRPLFRQGAFGQAFRAQQRLGRQQPGFRFGGSGSKRWQSTAEGNAHPSWFKRMWESEIGFKTVHFWAPVMKVRRGFTLSLGP